jgi:hypothetical protein
MVERLAHLTMGLLLPGSRYGFRRTRRRNQERRKGMVLQTYRRFGRIRRLSDMSLAFGPGH